MKRTFLAALLVFSMSIPVMAAEGLVNVESDASMKLTADRLENILKDKGMTIFNRINHSQSAADVCIESRDRTHYFREFQSWQSSYEMGTNSRY